MKERIEALLYADASDWREALLIRLKYVIYATFVFAAIIAFAASRSPGMRWSGLNMVLVLLVLMAVLSRARAPYALRAWLAILAVAYLATVSYVLAGFMRAARSALHSRWFSPRCCADRARSPSCSAGSCCSRPP